MEINQENISVDNDYVHRVCKPGYGAATCSYIGAMAKGWICMKKTELEAQVNRRRNEKSMVAMGDNCSGPPEFKLRVLN